MGKHTIGIVISNQISLSLSIFKARVLRKEKELVLNIE